MFLQRLYYFKFNQSQIESTTNKIFRNIKKN